MEIRISIFTVLAFFGFIIACLSTRIFYPWMLYLPLISTALFAIKFRAWSIGANLVNFVTFYIIFYYPVVFTYMIDLSENTLFYMGLCSGLCLFALYFLIYWHLAKEGNELALKNIESEVNDISRASEFNFPHPVDWEETKKTMERFSLALHFGLEGGFLQKDKYDEQMGRLRKYQSLVTRYHSRWEILNVIGDLRYNPGKASPLRMRGR